MGKKLLALFLVFCLCFSLAVCASAEETAHDYENQLIWSFDEDCGELFISGTGTVDPISSADEQPWAQYREQIRYVYIDQEAMYFVEDIAYWFSGCTNLVYAEIPGYWFVIGEDAFKDCANLQELLILTRGIPEIADTAFSAENPADLWIMVTSDISEDYVLNANWHGRTIDVANYADVATYDGPCGVHGCACTSCTYYWKYDQYDETYHWKYAACTTCSAHEGLYGERWEHTFNSNGICTICGYVGTASCTHGRYTYSWFGCDYYQYCYYCGEFMGAGTQHGTYTYDAWSYYSSSQHRRLYTCSDCGSGSYQYGYHATSTTYATYSDTQHQVHSYCATCATNVSTSYANHALRYGSWSTYTSDQHRRTKSCSTCGYSGYEYGSHADSNGDGKCDTCSYSMSIFSVTVPTSLPLVMDQNGNVSTPAAQIVNNSSGAVIISSVTLRSENGWKIVPYDTEMAHQKVDAKVVGFSLNGAATTTFGEEESLPMTVDWTIPQNGSLDLDYDAVISAVSQAVRSETILSAVFVLKWS